MEFATRIPEKAAKQIARRSTISAVAQFRTREAPAADIAAFREKAYSRSSHQAADRKWCARAGEINFPSCAKPFADEYPEHP